MQQPSIVSYSLSQRFLHWAVALLIFFNLAARLAHAGLYILIFAMPLSGIAAYYFGIDPAGSFHAGVLKIILWALIAAHVAGALVHQFYWKSNVLRRMTLG
ncbi:hypothetical protein GFM14_29870 [Rhizobium leguminosarum bv. viciae]|uniref:cytochrome b n=1 Tax=Rhizobium leguminosarum TaxID=384 RepID=UPI00144217CD|nr:cytochrome b/b6 domain-containing protein [Rhizobium leguminosarum]NKJ95691.1 hypothetical protein [Rhizobium leguminosarum bv. viciae]